jgi:hypothetical protein
VLSAFTAVMLAPNTRDENPPVPDVTGAVTTAVGIGTLVFAIIEGNDRGWTTPQVIAALVASVVSFASYAALGMRNDEPLLDPHLFGIRGFRTDRPVVSGIASIMPSPRTCGRP